MDVGQVYRVDASRRTTAANAYVNGLGHSKRVVLYDNLINDFPRDQMRSVVAHELGHQKHNDLLRGLAWLALVAPAGTFLPSAWPRRSAAPGAGRPGPRQARRPARDRPGDRDRLLRLHARRPTSSRARSRRAPTRSPCG